MDCVYFRKWEPEKSWFDIGSMGFLTFLVIVGLVGEKVGIRLICL